MLSSGAVRAQIASIVDALSKAAVAQIAKVVEDGMVVLRLEACQRDNEIKRLKSSIEVLHGELRAARAAQDRASRVRDDGNTGAERTAAHKHQTGLSASDVHVKREPLDVGNEDGGGQSDPQGGEVSGFDGDTPGWRLQLHDEGGPSASDFMALGQGSLSHLSQPTVDTGHSPSGFQNRTSYSAVRRRTVKRLMFKRGFVCPYCGKCFQRAGHFERHKRTHAGSQSRRGDAQAAEQRQIPDEHQRSDGPELEGQVEGQLAKDVDPPLATVQMKSEPEDENQTPPIGPLGNEDAVEGFNSQNNDMSVFDQDGPQWLAGLSGQDTLSSEEYPGSSTQSVQAFPGLAQLLPGPVDASCGPFAFPAKRYGDLPDSLMPRPPYGAPDALLISGESVRSSLHAMAGVSLGHQQQQQQQRRSRLFQAHKPKKCFACSFCGKIFERAGHLERHLRIHTGEKPYGCHICGRCFNQKSSLKGHMRTHRDGDVMELLDAQRMVFKVPDPQPPPQTSTEPKTRPCVQQGQLPGPSYGEAVGGQSLTVKVEPVGEDLQAPSQTGTFGGGGEAPDQLWTADVSRTSDSKGAAPGCSDASIQMSGADQHDIKRCFSPAGGQTDELPGGAAPGTDAALPNNIAKVAISHKDSSGSMLPSFQDQPVTKVEMAVEHGVTQGGKEEEEKKEEGFLQYCGGGGSSGSDEDRPQVNEAKQNCFICSSCGQSLDSFSLFQTHQCSRQTKPSLSCHVAAE